MLHYQKGHISKKKICLLQFDWMSHFLQIYLPHKVSSLQYGKLKEERLSHCYMTAACMCVTAITSGGVSNAQAEWQTRRQFLIQAQMKWWQRKNLRRFNEQCCNYSLHLFSSWSLSFQHCLCNRTQNVDSRFHKLTIHTKKKPWRV